MSEEGSEPDIESRRVDVAEVPLADMPEVKVSPLLELRPTFTRLTAKRQGADRRPRDRAEARDRAKQLEPLIREMQAKGYSMRRMATELTNRQVEIPRSGEWHPQTVKPERQRTQAHRH